MDKKRILILILFITSIIVIGLLLYFMFFKDLLGPPPVDNTNTANGNGVFPPITNGNISVVGNDNQPVGLPDYFGDTIDVEAPTDIARGGLTNVTDYDDKKVLGLQTGPSGTMFYDENTGLFYQLKDGEINPLSDKKFYNVDTVNWSDQGDKAVLEYPDGSNIVYNFKTNKQVTLPRELTDFAFDISGNNIAAKWYGDNDEENWLMMGDADGTDFQLIEPMGDRGHNVEVDYSPDNQTVALVRSAASSNTQTILPIGQHSENFKSFTVDGMNFESTWAPTENSLLYSVAGGDNDYKPTLWLTSGENQVLGTSHLDLQLSTWTHKCAYNDTGTSIYCAEPINLPRGSGLYPEIARGIPDVFYRIDLRSGQKIPLAAPVGDQPFYSASSVFLSEDESTLFFVDERTQQLKSIRLK